MGVHAQGKCTRLKTPKGNGCLEADVGCANLRKVPVVPTFTFRHLLMPFTRAINWQPLHIHHFCLIGIVW